jgi:excisionase family DNA binding protein
MKRKQKSVVMTVIEAGQRLGLSRCGAYEAAARGEIPIIRIGRLLKVPKVAFERMLHDAGKRKPAA